MRTKLEAMMTKGLSRNNLHVLYVQEILFLRVVIGYVSKVRVKSQQA